MKRKFYLKTEVWEILEATEDIKSTIQKLSQYPVEKVISPLIGAFCHKNEVVKWKAVTAFGYFTAKIAEKEMERARIIIRRLMWMLNEESGGMAWGVPEGYAEALYNSPALAKEYLPIFVSYLWNTESIGKYKADNYLEFVPAQRGVVWGLGRLAPKYKKELLAERADSHLREHLNSPDDVVKLLSVWALLEFKDPEVLPGKDLLVSLLTSIQSKSTLIFDGEKIREITSKELLKRL
ncbi:MAG: HEAT repeat domain-containing protein [Thermodesulfobacteria bacterium]|nr:HEAT repeat domain-containing protein [Thermodesulfobacteriota bacterium]